MNDERPTILIIEDDVVAHQYFAAILDEEYDLEFVCDAKDARVALEEKTYTLIFVDLALPGDQNGIELTRYIRKEIGSSTPILVITANVFPENRSEVMAAGANEFFKKPILAGTLLKALNKYKV